MAAATVGMRAPQDVSAMSVFGNQSPCGDKVCPAHLWTPLRLVLAAPVCLATSTAQMPGHNRWINTKIRNNYKGLLPFPDKTKQPFQWSGGCRLLCYSEMLKTSLQYTGYGHFKGEGQRSQAVWSEDLLVGVCNGFSAHWLYYISLLHKTFTRSK